jgi:hypothetical protein
MTRRFTPLVLLAIVAGCGSSGPPARSAPTPTPTPAPAPAATATGIPAPPARVAASQGDWTRFGYDAARTGVAPHGPSAGQVAGMRARTVGLPGTVDSSPVFLRRVNVRGATRDLLVVTTVYGRTLGLDARSGAELWRFTPSSHDRLAGSYQVSTASPIADPARDAVYAASPDGRIHKLSVANGREMPGWPVAVTRDAAHEKIPAALNLDGANVLVTTGGYLGDAPPYQGKVVAIDRATGHVARVLNTLCSNRLRDLGPRGRRRRARHASHLRHHRQRPVRRVHGLGRLGPGAGARRGGPAPSLHAGGSVGPRGGGRGPRLGQPGAAAVRPLAAPQVRPAGRQGQPPAPAVAAAQPP